MSEFMSGNDVDINRNVNESVTDLCTADNNTTPPPPVAANGSDKAPINADMKKKKSGAFGIFRAALLMLRKRTAREKMPAKTSIAKQNSTKTVSNSNWTKLVGSMRPLHLQETAASPPTSVSGDSEGLEEKLPHQQPPRIEERIHLQTLPLARVESTVEEMTISPASPAASSSSSRGTMSQYASATSLRDLCNSSDDEDEEEEEDPDEVFDALTGDEMIDAKAEEFIAQFYRQIQLQNTSVSRRHHDRGI